MIPTNRKFLQRTSLKSGGSFFSHDTWISKVERKGSLSHNEPDRSIRFHKTLLHESAHWIQHHGTSVGCFLQCLRFSQQNTTLSWLRSVPENQLLHLLELRRKGVPIIGIEEDANRATPKNDPDLDLFSQIWADHQNIHNLFFVEFGDDEFTFPVAQILGEVIGDVLSFIKHHEKIDCDWIPSDPLEQRSLFTPKQGECTLVSTNHYQLTTTILLECWSTISEIPSHHSQTLWSDHEESLNEITRKLSSSSYGVPLMILYSAFPSSSQDMMALAVLLIYIALNPPLPPYDFRPPAGREYWNWDDLYPPRRFMKLIEGVKLMGLANRPIYSFGWPDVIKELASNSGIPISTTCCYQFVSDNSGSNAPDRGSPTFMEDYSFWVQKTLAELHTCSPESILQPDGRFSSAANENLMLSHLTQETSPFKSPFAWDDDQLKFSGETTYCNELFQHSILKYCLFDFAVGSGDFDLTEYPPSVNGDRSWQEYIETTITKNLLESIT